MANFSADTREQLDKLEEGVTRRLSTIEQELKRWWIWSSVPTLILDESWTSGPLATSRSSPCCNDYFLRWTNCIGVTSAIVCAVHRATENSAVTCMSI